MLLCYMCSYTFGVQHSTHVPPSRASCGASSSSEKGHPFGLKGLIRGPEPLKKGTRVYSWSSSSFANWTSMSLRTLLGGVSDNAHHPHTCFPAPNFRKPKQLPSSLVNKYCLRQSGKVVLCHASHAAAARKKFWVQGLGLRI